MLLVEPCGCCIFGLYGHWLALTAFELHSEALRAQLSPSFTAMLRQVYKVGTPGFPVIRVWNHIVCNLAQS